MAFGYVSVAIGQSQVEFGTGFFFDEEECLCGKGLQAVYISYEPPRVRWSNRNFGNSWGVVQHLRVFFIATLWITESIGYE